MRFEIEVPYWAEEEERPEWLIFLALLYKLGHAYSFKSTFIIYDVDIRTILSEMRSEATGLDVWPILRKQPWSHNLIVGNMFDDKCSIQMKRLRRGVPGGQSRTKVIEDQRLALIWFYLQGCFNNNLVEGKEQRSRMGLSKDYKKLLKGGLL